MSNVSVILCVRHLIKDNCYSNINTVTEPMQCNYSTSMLVVNTNNFGAFKRVEKNESHEASVKMVDLNIYNVEFVDSVQQNQMIGETPNYCIPLTINAITVQGISYSDPYFSSFKLNYKMAFGAPEHMNKSDYAFKSSVCIIRDEPCDTQLLNDKSAHTMISKTKTRIITNEDKSVKTYHDNNELEVGYDKPAKKTALRMFANGDLTYDAMLELTRNEDRIIKDMNTQDIDSWGVPRRLRLCGGGESSLNAATGWGSPPASNNTGNWGGNSSGQTNNGTNNTQQWNNTAQRPPTSQADMNSNKGNGNQMPPTSGASAQNWQSSPPNMPNSQPNNNGAPTSNGTNNAGNGNNGGTNPPNSTPNSNGPTSANGNNGNNANSTSSAKIEQLNSMREALFSQDGWGGQHVNQDTNWDVPGSPEPGPGKVENQPAGGPPAWKPNINNGAFLGTDLWEANLRNGGQPPPQPAAKTPWGHTPTTNIGGTWGEDDDVADSANVWTGPPPPQQWPAGPPQHAQQWGVPKKDDWNAWGEPHRPVDPRIDPHRSSDPRQQSADPRHDLRGGISGRLNGDMWSQHHQHTGGPNKMMPGGVNQWGAQGPKDPIKGSGWEEPSPPAARRAPGGFDDGTSLWAQRGMGGMAARGPQGPPGPQRMPPTPTKPDAVWGAHGQRNGSWEEPHTPAWPDRDAPAWPDASGPALWPVPKPKPAGPGTAWPDDIGEWGGPKPPQGGPLGKQLPKEMVWNSKQFRFLVEMGFKKEEAEAALRSRDMNAEEALEMLASARGDGWRRDDHFGGHHGGPFQPPPSVPAVSPAVVQKILNQPPPPTQQHHQSYNPNSGTGNGGQPSAAQLRMLVQQIQMAVSAGYLNHQILNQPLAPQTLVLLNQLLQQIKVLQQLLQQNSLAMTKGHSSLALQYSVQITKAKQQITALQNQITAQQTLYMKQQAGSSDLFKQGHDPIAQLQNNFSDMSIPKDTQGGYGGSSGNQQSRLNQWKLPSLDKDGEGSEFSRAPGTAKSTTSPQLNQLGLQPDSTWGVGRGSEGWGDSGADVADGKDAWPSHPSHQPVYDLVPEFEPGKPWKGNQMKNVEDDPAMTPGSVVRSPLSLAVIKDADMLGGKTSPPGGERSLSSSTWSYAPPGGAGGGAALKADAWGAKPRPAPPGLNKAWPQHHSAAPPRAVSWQASTWLLLKNLTAQIDGSTLKTLCVQHGPLQNFHLYLNQGLALARYSTREEAAKAQMALNNCVLSNTTIFAESPAESEVQMILQHLGSGGGGAWRGGQKDGWGGFAALWPDSHDQRATPSSLNSFLPPDLLGGESI
nr:protein Gawky isoform X1 [Helicoverpa armigera]XP_021192521.2 protein Gawky isoform X1 [Helicoverpa armigera]XP_049699497.1 protein Gawky isoform X1 [Helicoverpa armigera]